MTIRLRLPHVLLRWLRVWSDLRWTPPIDAIAPEDRDRLNALATLGDQRREWLPTLDQIQRAKATRDFEREMCGVVPFRKPTRAEIH